MEHKPYRRARQGALLARHTACTPPATFELREPKSCLCSHSPARISVAPACTQSVPNLLAMSQCGS